MFFGRYEHSLDAKGRVVLPARFRAGFDTKAHLTQYLDGCLALWTPDEFNKRFVEFSQSQERGTAHRHLARFWSAGVIEVDIDRQGRVGPVPGHLKEYAHLDRNVLVVGAMERIELWDPQEWETRVQPAEADLRNPPDPVDPARS